MTTLAKWLHYGGLLALVLGSAATADEPQRWPQEPKGRPAGQLAQIVGSDGASWTIAGASGKPAEFDIETINGHPVLITRGSSTILTSSTLYGPDTEIVVRFRMASTDRATSVVVQAGLPDPANAKELGLRISVNSVRSVENHVTWQVTDPLAAPPQRPFITGTYHLRGAAPRSLDWPDHLRKLIENETASLPPLSEKWQTIRYRLRPEAFRLYLNDRLLMDRAAAGLKITGVARLTLGPNVQLATVRACPIASANPLFEPISLDSHLNATQIDGRSVARASLPAAGQAHLIQDVPFVFPEVDARGRDHIDVGQSWLQSGFLEGESMAIGEAGSIAGRWLGALRENPSRIQFRIPKGRYRAVHLIAAAGSNPDSVPIVTAQFYRPSSGAPEQFATRVPLLTAKSTEVTALPVDLDNGTTAHLYFVTIPVEPGTLALWDDIDCLEMELTKEVKLFRGYPDPSNYSFHGAGLPSSVHVYAMTLERPTVDMAITAEAYSHIWTAPAKPVYSVTLRSRTEKPRPVTLELATASFDGTQKTTQKARVLLPAGGNDIVQKFTLSPQRYGYHDLTLTLRDGDQVWTEKRSLAWLHEDTRQRGQWQPGRGPIYGFWNWKGGHHTPSAAKQAYVMGLAGIESGAGLTKGDAGLEERKVAEQFHMTFFKLFDHPDIYTLGKFAGDLQKMPVEEAEAKLLAALKKEEIKADDLNRAELVSFFPEPQIGYMSYGNLPSYWGERDYELTEQEEARYQLYERGFVLGARLIKKYWPLAICTMPHGDPQFPVIFLRRSKEVRELFGGVTVDMPGFEHLPEKQLHQSAFQRLYVCREEYHKAGITNPVLAMYEGPCLPNRPGSLTPQEQAALLVRGSVILLVYGVDRQLGGWAAHEPADYWGEQHYGGGVLNRIPLETPRPAYAALATMTRHLNRKNFCKWVPSGSLSVYTLQFKHFQSGVLTHVMWTLRGRRPVTLAVPKGTTVTVYDQMDNAAVLKEEAGTVNFILDTSPCYVEGLGEDAQVTLGEPDHGDAAPAKGAVALANLGDGTWKLSAVEDSTYAQNHHEQLQRFLGRMSVAAQPAPEAQGGKALAMHLGQQEVQRKIMPFYTTLLPRQPITIPGKASHFGLWVKASSDWGRVVYCLRDAQGERWMNIGQREQWNCDDPHCWSYFCFDGWRYLRFELPANSPYDTYREAGSTWWGHSGQGDGIVDLPLVLEKIIVERRTHALYVNDPQPTRPDDVLLAGLYAEYERPDDRTNETVRLAGLRMPIPTEVPDLGNPIVDLAAAGVGPPTTVTHITLHEQEADGTRCFVHFTPVEGAKSYDVWVSPYLDGRSAVQLGKAWLEPGRLIRGLRPEMDFYVFVVYTDQNGKPSKPSPPLHIRLTDMFGMK